MQTNEAPAAPWKGRGRLQQLVAELDRQKQTKLDFVADARHLMVVAGNGGIMLAPSDGVAQEWMPAAGLDIGHGALPQFGSRVEPNIPTRFLRDLAAQHPSTAAGLINDLLQVKPGRHFIRCLDGKVRAFLSNSYRVLDNFDLAFAALGVAREHNAEVIEATLTDTNMRIKFTTKGIWDAISEKQERGEGSHNFMGQGGWDLPGGHGTVHPLVTVSNSETGHGGLNVQIGIVRAFCVNMAVIESVQTHIHLGGKLEAGVYSEETLAMESKTIMLKCRDAIKAAFTPERFKKLMAKVNQAAETPVERPREAVENIIETAGLTDDDHDAILGYFLGDYDRNKYGLAQAVSRYSQDVEDADSAYELEQIAGKVLAGAM